MFGNNTRPWFNSLRICECEATAGVRGGGSGWRRCRNLDDVRQDMLRQRLGIKQWREDSQANQQIVPSTNDNPFVQRELPAQTYRPRIRSRQFRTLAASAIIAAEIDTAPLSLLHKSVFRRLLSEYVLLYKHAIPVRVEPIFLLYGVLIGGQGLLAARKSRNQHY